MKISLLSASFAILASSAFANFETSSSSPSESVGVLPEFVVSVRKPVGTESVGVLPDYVVSARKPAGTESVGVLPDFVVVARKVSRSEKASRPSGGSVRPVESATTPALSTSPARTSAPGITRVTPEPVATVAEL